MRTFFLAFFLFNLLMITNATKKTGNTSSSSTSRGGGSSSPLELKSTQTQTLNVNSTVHAASKIDGLTKFVEQYALPIIVSVGLIGNILTIIILSKEKDLTSLYDINASFKENLKQNYLKRTSTSAPNSPENSLVMYNNEMTGGGGRGGGGESMRKPSPVSEAATKRQQFLRAKLKSKMLTTGKFNMTSKYSSQFSSTNYFIFSLAVSDLVYNFVLALMWLTTNDIINVLNRDYVCQISVMTTYVCSFLSAAFTTLFTFQRFMAIVNPLKSATSFALQSTRVIRMVVLALFIFACLLYSISLVLYDNEPKKQHLEAPEKEVCGVKEKHFKVRLVFDNTVDFLLTAIIPSIGILIMNFAICKSLADYRKTNIFNTNGGGGSVHSTTSRAASPRLSGENNNNGETVSLNRQQREQKSPTPGSLYDSVGTGEGGSLKKNNLMLMVPLKGTDNDSIGKKSSASEPMVRVGRKKAAHMCINKERESRSNAANSTRITKTLLIVSFCFITLNMPYRVSQLISSVHALRVHSGVPGSFEYKVNLVLINLFFASYSMNFFLYSLCGKKFRYSLRSLIFYLIFTVYFRILKIFNCIFKRK
jgi:hypothetical protein